VKSHTPKPLVLCEGKEDLLVIQALANHVGLAGNLIFQQYGGKDQLRAYLRLLKTSPEYARGEYSRILITRDADLDFASSWQALKDSIEEVFSCEPTAPGEWIRRNVEPEIAAWIIPGPGKTGMLETLCMESSRTKSPQVLECLDAFMTCLAAVHGEEAHEKTRFAIWTIAAQGAGAQKRLSLERAIPMLHIDWDDVAYAPLRDLLIAISP
jgi:hypothetical protein